MAEGFTRGLHVRGAFTATFKFSPILHTFCVVDRQNKNKKILKGVIQERLQIKFSLLLVPGGVKLNKISS